jgi:ABC-type polysaccharide/polyol phosphate transport system ATPase subunit
MKTPIIQTEAVSKCFRIYRAPSDRLKEVLTFGRKQYHEPFWAVKDITVAVEPGCCLGIIGENGSGKSTLLRMLAGVIRPTAGAVNVRGRVSALLELGAGFNPQFSGRENVYLNASILGFTDGEKRDRLPAIEKFAEIGEFIDRPVKTYSSGMFVRLAFAVAIHMDPDVLIVDEALSVGDVFFQQRCMRRIQQMKRQGVTIVFVSHDLAAVRNLADRTIWMEHGCAVLHDETELVVAKYLAAMVMRGRSDVMEEEALGRPLAASQDLDIPEEAIAKIPAFLTHIPNIDHRYGNGKARIEGVGLFGSQGNPASAVAQGERLCLRISISFLKDCQQPNVGFVLRNRLGEDVTATNSMLEGNVLGPAKAGDRVSVDFVMDLPFLQSGFYHISPAVADGTLDNYDMCDWVDNACALEVIQNAITYGHMRIPVRVRAVAIKQTPHLS